MKFMHHIADNTGQEVPIINGVRSEKLNSVRGNESRSEEKNGEDASGEDRKKADQANLYLQEFVYAVSHDLSAPLRAVNGFSNLLSKDYASQLDDKGKRYIKRIGDGAVRMHQLISGVTEFARIVSKEPKIVVVELDDLMQDVIDDLYDTIKEAHATVSWDSLPKVAGDSIQLHQLFRHLIENSIRFRSEAPPVVHVSYENCETGYVLKVSDNGIGIQEEFLEDTFKMFRRIGVQDQDCIGIGAGLTICRRIVQQHGGQIHLKSELGVGTQAIFSIASKTQPQTPTVKTILLIGDDWNTISHWRQTLNNIERRVIVASTARAAIKILESTRIDLLITDISTAANSGINAKLDGLQIISHVALNLDPLPGIIVLSGGGPQVPFVDRNFESFDSLIALRKPITDYELSKAVGDSLKSIAKLNSDSIPEQSPQVQSPPSPPPKDRQKVSELLKATQFRLEQTQFSLDHAPDGVYWINENAQLVYTNQWNCDLLGYSKQELLSMTVVDLSPAIPSVEFFQSEILPKITEAGISFEREHRRKDGSSVAVEISARMLSYEGVRMVCAYVRDISLRKEKEAELVAAKLAAEESEHRFRSLANSASPLIWTTELDSMCSWLNDRWIDYVGKSRKSQLGQGWVDSIHPDDRERATRAFASAFQKQLPFKVEYRLKRHDGDYRWFTVNANPRYDNEKKFVGYVGMNFDSHDDRLHLKQLEQSHLALEKSNLMRDAVLQLLETSDGVWHWSVGTEICYFAPGFRKLIGFDAHDVEGFPNTLAAFEARVHPEDHTELWETITESIENKTAFFFEFRLRQKNEQYLWVKARGNASYDDEGKPLHLVGSTYDISDTKDAQLKLEQEGAALIRSNADLAQFAYVASHDLQEPLRAVGGFLQLLENKYSDLLDEQGRGYIQKSIAGAGRMNQLINDLLLFSKVTRTDAEFNAVDLNAVVDEASLELEQAIAETNTSIEFEGLPTIKGAAPLLVQLVRNLIGNSIKYRGDDNPVIKITHTLENEEYVIRFQDNGIGIAPEYQQQVFELFKRLHHRSEHSGTGIGLAICKRVVERHGGTISIDFNNQPGSCFVVRFQAENLRDGCRQTDKLKGPRSPNKFDNDQAVLCASK